MADAVIRPYREEDRVAVRNIAWETALWGEPAGRFFSDKEIFADFLTLYFTDHEPESCWVAEAEGKVAGYLIGAVNSKRLERVFLRKIFWHLCLRSMIRGTFLNGKNSRFLFLSGRSFWRGEFRAPDFTKDYPATLHINLGKDFRGCGIGERLMAAYNAYLAKNNIPGVQLSTMSEKGAAFFKKQGFVVLHSGLRSYFSDLGYNPVFCLIMGKRIS